MRRNVNIEQRKGHMNKDEGSSWSISSGSGHNSISHFNNESENITELQTNDLSNPIVSITEIMGPQVPTAHPVSDSMFFSPTNGHVISAYSGLPALVPITHSGSVMDLTSNEINTRQSSELESPNYYQQLAPISYENTVSTSFVSGNHELQTPLFDYTHLSNSINVGSSTLTIEPIENSRISPTVHLANLNDEVTDSNAPISHVDVVDSHIYSSENKTTEANEYENNNMHENNIEIHRVDDDNVGTSGLPRNCDVLNSELIQTDTNDLSIQNSSASN